MSPALGTALHLDAMREVGDAADAGLFIAGIMLANRGGQRLGCDIPTELRQAWGVDIR